MPHELLADVRRVSGRAAVEDNDHGVVELLVEACDDYSYFRRQVVSFFQNSDFASLQAHKEGGFVGLPRSLPKFKSHEANVTCRKQS